LAGLQQDRKAARCSPSTVAATTVGCASGVAFGCGGITVIYRIGERAAAHFPWPRHVVALWARLLLG
jgi:hypothetical protein